MNDFEKATTKILKAINEIKTESKNEELSKFSKVKANKSTLSVLIMSFPPFLRTR